MPELKVEIPEELEKEINEFKLDWSEVAMKAIVEKTEKLKRLKAISSKIKISGKSAGEFTDKISEAVAKRF
jgi:hypothetical protein